MDKMRLDELLVKRELVANLTLAQRMVMAGQVRINGQLVLQSGARVLPDVIVEIDYGPKYVSRGGDKLAAALSIFDINLSGKICCDVGASTGGFTDCLLQAGANKVYAIDVGKGILDWKLRNDPRVVVMEGVNARFVEELPESVDLVTIDASFISLKVLIPVVKDWLRETGGELVLLIKPQFEAERSIVQRTKGVIRDPEVHRVVLMEILNLAEQEGFKIGGLIHSPLLGPKGNREFLAWLVYSGKSFDSNLETLISSVLK
jgi:23S rRNA (cytidine1920-2'-O)/16S rRNA (cytidine1409-2'-O)-methyltransferase